MALPFTLYGATNGSPKTTLTVALSTSGTTMTVADASLLPPAPNLAVIGNEVDAEIVLYNNVSGNVLNIVRGINGTQALNTWAVGTEVARNFTAYDHDAVKACIEYLEGQKSGIGHGHIINDIQNLQTALDAKADETEITELETEIAGKADASHTHTIANVTNLQTALDAKADASDITDLEEEIAGKADASHTHTIANVTNLQTALDAKADETEITELEEEIAGKADASHTHAISEVTDLQTALNGKAPSYTYSTTDLTAGTSALTTGTLYFVYE